MEITRGKIASAQKCVIFGPEGIGKSTFAAQFPNPVFIDTEGSTKHMDVARTPRPSSWAMLLEQVKYFKAHPQKCDSLIIDTADWAEQLCIIEICAKANKGGIEDFGYGKGYVYLAEEFGKLLNYLEELIELGINVVLTAHAQMRKFEQPDEMGAYDRWEMKLQKKTAPLVKEWADMVLFANYETYVVKTDDKKNKAQGGKRVINTAHHPCWDAKNRHGLDLKLPLDYKAIAHCIPSEPGQQTQQTQQTHQSEVAFLGDEQPKSPDVKREHPKQQEPKSIPPTGGSNVSPAPAQKQEITVELKGVPKPLADLMLANDVTVEEIQQAVSSRGYYPKNTPIENYDPNFITGVLVGAWVQVFQMIKDFRDDVPF
ncbi:ATP-binding protein [Paradesulfitobacterium aromaticivorans]